MWGAAPALSPPRTGVPCVDLFASIGGWSTGAAQAGHRVVLAVDNDPKALAVHALNHPQTTHLELTLGPETEEALVAAIRAALPADGVWHLHGSPPCTTVSTTAFVNAHRSHDDVRERQRSVGFALVDWFLALVRRLQPTSWSFEQVRHKEVLRRLQEWRRQAPSVCDFDVVDLSAYGVPQTRTRVLAGSPWLMHRLRFEPSLRVPQPVSVRDALPNLDPSIVYVRELYDRPADQSATETVGDVVVNPLAEKKCRPLDMPSYTLTTNVRSVAWWDASFRFVRRLSIPENLALQTFPCDYRFPDELCHGARVRGIGNAYPCIVARKLMSNYRLPE